MGVYIVLYKQQQLAKWKWKMKKDFTDFFYQCVVLKTCFYWMHVPPAVANRKGDPPVTVVRQHE